MQWQDKRATVPRAECKHESISSVGRGLAPALRYGPQIIRCCTLLQGGTAQRKVKGMDDRRKELMEELEEVKLSLLMDSYAEADGARFLEEFERDSEKIVLPDKLDQACNEYIDTYFEEETRKKKRKRTALRVLKVTVFVFLIVGALCFTVTHVKAIKAPLVNSLLKSDGWLKDVGMAIINDTNLDSDKVDNKFERLATCVPSGYELLVDDTHGAYTGGVAYVNDKSEIISFASLETDASMDYTTEGREVVEMKILHYDGYFMREDALLQVIWLDPERDRIYELFTTGFSEDDFWDLVYTMAE